MAPGNAGWPDVAPLAIDDPAAVVAWCVANEIGFVVVGPEAALAAGVVDALSAAGIAAFGPTRAAAQLEWSKAHTRAVADELGLPSPAFTIAASIDEARAWCSSFGRPVVVKASGLAAGKGVIVPDGPEATDAALVELLDAFGEIVIEERLRGPEVSLLAFCDGTTVRAMPPAQDHKRIGEGDTGPNTGGMGAYAPAPVCPPAMVDQLVATVLQPVVDHLAASGTPYVGVLYGGFMLTADGPRLLEFNCRFGDPETQVLVPLLDGDLLAVMEACVTGRLSEIELHWRHATACTVVLAAEGYPAAPVTGAAIEGLDDETGTAAMVFHAGTRLDGETVRVAGGRVLAVTGLGPSLADARAVAYDRAAAITWPGRQMRRDIGWRAVAAGVGSYAAAGVDIDAGNDAVSRMKAAVEATHGPAVLRGVGSFGGVFDVSVLARYANPVLVASTDGVGTKVELAARAGRHRVSGMDIVNHCINDVLVQRARPLFFLDYVASSKLVPSEVAEVVGGMAEACGAAGCALLGGETAEMPGVYAPGAFDVAGTLVGAADRDRLLPRTDLNPGDLLVGLASNGPHTNGYSLLRKLFDALPLDAQPAPLEVPLVDALLQPHRNYLPVLEPVLDSDIVKALIHITGGGLPENLPRAFPAGIGAVVRRGSWPLPPLFALVREIAEMDDHELHRTLNMGIGMVIVVAPEDLAELQGAIAETSWVIGELVAGSGVELA